MTARMSSMRSSRGVAPGTRSLIPMPRLSNRISLENSPSRSQKWRYSGSSHMTPRWVMNPSTHTRSTGPSPTTWYATSTSPLRANRTAGVITFVPGMARSRGAVAMDRFRTQRAGEVAPHRRDALEPQTAAPWVLRWRRARPTTLAVTPPGRPSLDAEDAPPRSPLCTARCHDA